MLPVKALSKFFIPMSTVLHHRIQDSQLLAHTGYQGYFFGLTCGQQPFVHGFDLGVVLDRRPH